MKMVLNGVGPEERGFHNLPRWCIVVALSRWVAFLFEECTDAFQILKFYEAHLKWKMSD